MATPSSSSRPSSLLHEVEQILASPEFASARQLRDFFLFVAQQAAAGRENLDQHDIAFGVLNRDETFDPATDASVRRLATQLRQRLEKYYAGTGRESTWEVFLPSRSYLPVLRERIVEAAAEAVTDASEKAATSRRFPWLWILAVALTAAGLGWWLGSQGRGTVGKATSESTQIRTAKGDLMGTGGNAPADAVRLGGVLEEGETVFVPLRFSPKEERQQAGLILYQGQDDYVRFGRFFGSRTNLEIGQEVRGQNSVLRVNSVYDAAGQTGAWLHLALERRAGKIWAYTSRDGVSYEAFGEALPWPETFTRARVGVYALNGRRDSPAQLAEFGPLRKGVLLGGAAWGGQAWKASSDCAEEPQPLFFAAARIDPKQECIQRLVHAAPGGAWTLETHFEKSSEFGLHLGIGAWGGKGSVTLSRYFNKSPVIAWIWYGVRFESIPDYPGAPPVYLRVRSNGQEVWGEASPNGELYDRVGTPIPLDRLGALARVGMSLTFHAGQANADSSGAVLPGYRVHWLSLREEKLELAGEAR